jgi:hypothetical protein
MITFFKRQLNENYFKGFIDRDETQLFYDSHLTPKSLSPSVPIIQINFQNQVDENGRIKVRFRIATMALVFFGLLCGLIAYLIFRSDNVDGVLTTSFALASIYAILLIFYRAALTSFKAEIEKIDRK